MADNLELGQKHNYTGDVYLLHFFAHNTSCAVPSCMQLGTGHQQSVTVLILKPSTDFLDAWMSKMSKLKRKKV